MMINKRRVSVSVALSLFIIANSPVAQAAPTNTVLPAITGIVAVGNTVQVGNGTWGGAVESYSYQWRRCADAVATNTCVAISGATATSYVIVQADSTKYLRVSVTALDVTGGTTVLTAPTAVVIGRPINTGLPQLSGSLVFASSLTTTSGTWSTPNAGVYTYKWLRCSSTVEATCTYISGASSSTYAISATDGSLYLRSEATVMDATNRVSSSARSSAAGPVTSEPRNISLPVIVGEPVTGQVIRFDSGTWVANPAATFSALWQKCASAAPESCASIAGQTAPTLTLTDADLNLYFRVQITAINTFSGTLKFSPVFGPIVKPMAPTTKTAPVLSGIAKEGETLSVTNGTWNGFPVPTYSYTWQRCDSANACTAIAGATSATYKLTFQDAGFAIKASVRATNSVGNATATSNAISGVLGVLTPFLAPQVSGVAIVGQTLESDPGIWTGSNSTDYLHKWQRCTSTMTSTCSDIAGAVVATHKISTADQGRYLRSGVAIRNLSQFAFSDLTDRVPLPAVSSKFVKGKSCTVKGKRVTSGTKSLICRNVKGKLVWF